MTDVNLSKLDVAKRELEHAIKLFFKGGDFVIVHLVISACQDVLEGIGGDKVSFRMEMLKLVKKEKQAYVAGKLKHAYNFFKHADRDANELLEFNSEASVFLIIDAISMYQSLTHEITGVMMAFRLWFNLKFPDLLLVEEQKKLFTEASMKIDVNNKLFFLEIANNFEINRT